MTGLFQVRTSLHVVVFVSSTCSLTCVAPFADAGELPVPVLSIENVSFAYPGGKELYNSVDFGVDLQTRVALVGPNGAGKVRYALDEY